MLDAWGQEDEIVLTHDVIFAVDVHQAFTFDDMIDLFPGCVLVPLDVSHRPVHGKTNGNESATQNQRLRPSLGKRGKIRGGERDRALVRIGWSGCLGRLAARRGSPRS